MDAVRAGISDKALYNGSDDRYNIFDVAHLGMRNEAASQIQEHAKSVACMVDKSALKILKNGDFKLKDTRTLVQQEYLNKGQNFSNEPAPGYGTAFLIAPKLMATAAHNVCIDETDEVDEEAVLNTYIVFDFRMIDATKCTLNFPADTVYKIERIVAHQYCKGAKWSDWAVVELDREVKGRKSLEFETTVTLGSRVYMIGHPAGLPEKYTQNAIVKSTFHPSYFETDLEAFEGNSGSPVFDAVRHLVVGILINGNKDYNPDRTLHQVTPEEILEYGYEYCQRIAPIKELVTNDSQTN